MSGEGDGDRASRPSSLLLDAPQPEREPLHFDVQLIGAPPEVEQLVNNIKQVAEEFLYHWKTFPIVLPPSKFTSPGSRPCDIIIAPPCDELDAAALDAGSEPQRLSPKQLHSIRERGEFEVPSRHFPGQTHVWRVSGWLQRGRVRAREQLYRHVACALALVAVTARDRLLADKPLSLRAALRALCYGLRTLLDLLIGMPSLEARDLEKKIREERARYLVAELVCKPEHRSDLSALAAWVSRAIRRAAAEKGECRSAPAVPCVYTTPQRTHIDLRLYRRELLRKAAPALQNILDREARGWFLHFRERHAARLASQKMPLKEIEEEVREAAMEEYVTRVCGAVLASETLGALGPGVPALLAAQLRASAVVTRAEDSARRRLEAGVQAAEARLRASHPLLSRAPAWRREKLDLATERLRAELRWAASEEALAGLTAHKLHQHRYFLARDLAFLREREPLLAAELLRARTPTRTFTWSRREWSQDRWRVTRHGHGRAERVPTVLLGARRRSPQPPRSDPTQPVFLLSRDATTETSTRYAGWRLANLAHRTVTWTWNVMYVLGVLVPWCSPIALRTLFCLEPFYVDYELSQVNGTLYPKPSSLTPTMWSRLLDLWRHVARERRKFDTEPDTGLLGKGMSRIVHLVWMYGCVGGGGSAALLLLWPAGCAACCVPSALLAALAPLWVPPAALAAHAACALLYDADAPRAAAPRVLPAARAALHAALLGALQAALALAAAVCIVPAALLLAALAVLTEGCRAVWERGAWAWLARGARVPQRAGRAVTRVAGPGLNSPPALKLEAAPALAMLAARAELDALSAWQADTEHLAERPLREYRQFVTACFGPFSVRIAETGSYRVLQRECAELVAEVRAAVDTRRALLACPLSEAQRKRVRLEHADLAAVVEAGGAHAARVGPAAAGDEWWAARGLDPGDWTGLAANTLADAFSPDVLVPLESGAAALALEAGGAARGWAAGGARPPDVLAGVARGWAAAPRLPPPALDAAAFSPRHPRHPPLPPPALAALVLHNRDADAPVPLEAAGAADVLRALEDAPDADDARDSTVERYRGGRGSTPSSPSCSLSDDEDRPDPPAAQPATAVADTARGGTAGGAGGGACRWTLTGRGVRLRADLASPEDVTLDVDHRGTSV